MLRPIFHYINFTPYVCTEHQSAPAGVGAPPLDAQLHSLTQVDKDSIHYCASGHSSVIGLILASDSQSISEHTIAVMPFLVNSDFNNSVFLQVEMKATKQKV